MPYNDILPSAVIDAFKIDFSHPYNTRTSVKGLINSVALNSTTYGTGSGSFLEQILIRITWFSFRYSPWIWLRQSAIAEVFAEGFLVFLCVASAVFLLKRVFYASLKSRHVPLGFLRFFHIARWIKMADSFRSRKYNGSRNREVTQSQYGSKIRWNTKMHWFQLTSFEKRYPIKLMYFHIPTYFVAVLALHNFTNFPKFMREATSSPGCHWAIDYQEIWVLWKI